MLLKRVIKHGYTQYVEKCVKTAHESSSAIGSNILKLSFIQLYRNELADYNRKRMRETELHLMQKANQADFLIEELKRQIAELKRSLNRGNKPSGQLEELMKENTTLKEEVSCWKNKLVMAEILCGIRQIPVPVRSYCPSEAVKTDAPAVKQPELEKQMDSGKSETKQLKSEKRKDKTQKSEKPKSESKKAGEEGPVDVSRLDLRVGKIKDVKKHPDADTLYVEDVDVGEEKTRTVVSGLVKHVPIEQMKDKMVVLLCNLKPAKMRGVTSEAMVMCASTPEKVEILIPPEGSICGDLVEVEGFSRNPDDILNPKKKIFETVAPDLKVDENKNATYKGKCWNVPGKGTVVSPSLTGVAIK